jgi:hypothetical protein
MPTLGLLMLDLLSNAIFARPRRCRPPRGKVVYLQASACPDPNPGRPSVVAASIRKEEKKRYPERILAQPSVPVDQEEAHQGETGQQGTAHEGGGRSTEQRAA